ADNDWMKFTKVEGEVKARERITLSVDKSLLKEKVIGHFDIECVGFGTAHTTVEVMPPQVVPGHYMESDGFVCIEAEHFSSKKDTAKGSFEILSPYGRSGSAIKVFPSTADFLTEKKRPSVEYKFWVEDEGDYELTFDLAPTTPTTFKTEQYLGYSVNEEEICIVNSVHRTDIPYFLSPQWAQEAKDNVKKVRKKVHLKAGKNTLQFYGMSPGIVLERVLFVRDGVTIPSSYLGPKESYLGD
nr:hypothetical protein [Butyrivibrio sp.]